MMVNLVLQEEMVLMELMVFQVHRELQEHQAPMVMMEQMVRLEHKENKVYPV